mgnify:CR=1 FL=1
MIVLKVKHRLVEYKCFAYFCRKFLVLFGVDRDTDCGLIIVRHRFCFVYTVFCIALFSFVFYHGVDRMRLLVVSGIHLNQGFGIRCEIKPPTELLRDHPHTCGSAGNPSGRNNETRRHLEECEKSRNEELAHGSGILLRCRATLFVF